MTGGLPKAEDVLHDSGALPDSLVSDLADNTEDGAGTLARRALGGLRAHIETTPAADIEQVLRWTRLLMGARPGIGAINSLLQYWMDTMSPVESGDDLRTSAIEHCDRVLIQADRAFEITARVGVERLSAIPGYIVTHSASSTVRALLASVPSRRVIVAASAPGGEGRTLAAELGARCVSDGEAARWVAEAGAVVVGADAIGTRTFVNKIGTLALARAAHKCGKTFLVAAESFKRVPMVDPPVLEAVFEAVPNALVGEFLSDNLFGP